MKHISPLILIHKLLRSHALFCIEIHSNTEKSEVATSNVEQFKGSEYIYKEMFSTETRREQKEQQPYHTTESKCATAAHPHDT